MSDIDSNIGQDGNKEDHSDITNQKEYKQKRSEERKHEYFYEKTTPLSRLIKIAQHQTKRP